MMRLDRRYVRMTMLAGAVADGGVTGGPDTLFAGMPNARVMRSVRRGAARQGIYGQAVVDVQPRTTRAR